MKLYQTLSHILAKRDTAAQADGPAAAEHAAQAAVAVAGTFLPEGATLDAEASTPGKIVVKVREFGNLECICGSGECISKMKGPLALRDKMLLATIKALHHKTA